MSSIKRKQDKPTKSMFPKLNQEFTRVKGKNAKKTSVPPVQPEVRKSSRVPKKKVPVDAEIPIPKKRNKPQEASPQKTVKKHHNHHWKRKRKQNKDLTFDQFLKDLPSVASEDDDDGEMKHNILDIDVLRKLPASDLVKKYAEHTVVVVPKNKECSVMQHVYACKMLPTHCFEKFTGVTEETEKQITRHMLRHVGELLTMANQGIGSTNGDRETPGSVKDETIEEEGHQSSQRTILVPSNPKPFTLSSPSNVRFKGNQYTVIRSHEGNSEINEVVLLPRGQKPPVFQQLKSKNHFVRNKNPEGASTSYQDILNGLYGVEKMVAMKKEAAARKEQDDDSDSESNSSAIFETDLPEEPSGMPPIDFKDVVKLNKEDMDYIQMAVEVASDDTTSLASSSASKNIERDARQFQSSESQSEINQKLITPFQDHNYSFVNQTSSQETSRIPQGHSSTLESQPSDGSEPEGLDIVPILFSINEQMSKLISDIEEPDPDGPNSAKQGETTTEPAPQEVKVEPRNLLATLAEASLNLTMEDDQRDKERGMKLLDNFMKSKNRKGPFVCEICQKVLSAASTLKAHYRSHAGIKPYRCKECNATFTRQHSLNYHMMIHNKESRFRCSFCMREFRHSSHFREHLRRHTGEEPFGCTDCTLRFKTRNTYKRHMKSKHGKLVTENNLIRLIQ